MPRSRKATGLTLDLTARGMGLRCNRYSMLVVDGVVKTLNVEGPGKFEVSDADTMLHAGQGSAGLKHCCGARALDAPAGLRS